MKNKTSKFRMVMATAILAATIGAPTVALGAEPDYSLDRGEDGKFILPTVEESEAQAKPLTARMKYKNSEFENKVIKEMEMTLTAKGPVPADSVIPAVMKVTFEDGSESVSSLGEEFYKSNQFEWIVNGKPEANFKPKKGATYEIALGDNKSGEISNVITVEYTKPIGIPIIGYKEKADGTYVASYWKYSEVKGAVTLPSEVAGFKISEVEMNGFQSETVGDINVLEGIKKFTAIQELDSHAYAFQIEGNLKLPNSLTAIHIEGGKESKIFKTRTGALVLPLDNMKDKDVVLKNLMVSDVIDKKKITDYKRIPKRNTVKVFEELSASKIDELVKEGLLRDFGYKPFYGNYYKSIISDYYFENKPMN